MAVAAAHEQCPWCGSAIAHAKFVEVQTRIRAEEQKRLEVAEADARTRFEEAIKDAREKLERANAERAAFEAKLKEAIESAAAEHAKKLAAELANTRALLKADFDKQMLKQAADVIREKEEVAKKMAELQRKLDAQGSHEDVIEVDVYEALKAAFAKTDDKIVRMPMGEGSADVLVHEVAYKGQVCGRILVDTKHRRNWQSSYATKLHDEMVGAKAEHAILATVAFPKDQHELCEQDGVLLVLPARVVELVTILRRALVTTCRAKLSTEERAEKKVKLYDFVTSATFRQKLAEPGLIAASLLELDVEEKAQLDRILKKRGAMLRKLENVVAEVTSEIAEIVDGVEP
jgi:hypothetical protein